jgi:hypothetical protein
MGLIDNLRSRARLKRSERGVRRGIIRRANAMRKNQEFKDRLETERLVSLEKQKVRREQQLRKARGTGGSAFGSIASTFKQFQASSPSKSRSPSVKRKKVTKGKPQKKRSNDMFSNFGGSGFNRL